MFFPLQFSTLNTSHHTPFLYVSILSPLSAAVPLFCHNKTKHYSTLLFIQKQPKSRCSWTTVVLHCAYSGLVQQMKPPDTDREYGNIRSLMIGLMERKLSEIWNIIIVMAFECLNVCLLCLFFGILLSLNCAFNILNGVRDLRKSSCESYDDFGGSPSLCLLFVAMPNHWWWPVRPDKKGIIYRLTCYT